MLVVSHEYKMEKCPTLFRPDCVHSKGLIYAVPEAVKDQNHWTLGGVQFTKLKERQARAQAAGCDLAFSSEPQPGLIMYFDYSTEKGICAISYHYKVNDQTIVEKYIRD